MRVPVRVNDPIVGGQGKRASGRKNASLLLQYVLYSASILSLRLPMPVSRLRTHVGGRRPLFLHLTCRRRTLILVHESVSRKLNANGTTARVEPVYIHLHRRCTLHQVSSRVARDRHQSAKECSLRARWTANGPRERRSAKKQRDWLLVRWNARVVKALTSRTGEHWCSELVSFAVNSSEHPQIRSNKNMDWKHTEKKI